MLTTRVDQGVLGYLGRALSLEFSAVQLYSTQSRLVAYWGLASAAERLRHEAEEELQHTDRIIERMLALGVAPNASQLRPVKLGENLVEMLGINQRFEQELIDLYHAAASHSARIGDHDSRLFFNTLLEEERAHHRELLEWQAQLWSGEIGD
jgi:bacterioferritin